MDAGQEAALIALFETLDAHSGGRPLDFLAERDETFPWRGKRELRRTDLLAANPYCWGEIRNSSIDLAAVGGMLAATEFPWLIVEQACKKLRAAGCLFLYLSAGTSCPIALDVLARSAGLLVLEYEAAQTPWCVAMKEPRLRPPRMAARVPNDADVYPIDRRHPLNPLTFDMDILREPEDNSAELVNAIRGLQLQDPRVLELSCYSSWLMRYLKAMLSPAIYRRIEVFPPEETCLAAGRIDDVVLEHIDTPALVEAGLPLTSFDLLVVHDSLERIFDPWETLHGVVPFLRPGGHAVVAAPNVQHWSVLSAMSRGKWNRIGAALDPYCIRHFSLPELADLCVGAGLAIDSVAGKATMQEGIDANRPDRFGRLQLAEGARQDVTPFELSEYIIVARRLS